MMKIQIFFIWVIVAIMVCFVAVNEIASFRYLIQYYCHFCEDNEGWILQFDADERMIYYTCELCGKRSSSFEPKEITDLGTTEVDCHGNYYTIQLWRYVIGGERKIQEVYFAHNTGTGANHLNTVETKPAVAPTCTTEGCTAEITCADCHEIVQSSIVIPASHDIYLVGAIDSTCQVQGFSGDAHCHNCDYFEAGRVLPLADHDTYTIGAKSPTCSKPGFSGDVYCHNCSYTCEGVEVETLPHDLRENPGRNPTCMQPGYTTSYDCKNCSYHEGGTRIPEVDHDYFKNAWGNYECAWCKRIKN